MPTADLPVGQNSPQKPPYGLILSYFGGSAFTAKRHENLRSWLLKIVLFVPLVKGDYKPLAKEFSQFQTAPLGKDHLTPAQLRWNPLPEPSTPTNFIEGIKTVAANGDGAMRHGSAIHLYYANKDMEQEFFYNSDGNAYCPAARNPAPNNRVWCSGCGAFGNLCDSAGVKFQVQLADGKAPWLYWKTTETHLSFPT